MLDIRDITRCDLLEWEEDHATKVQYGKFSIEPLEVGWGITVGNALRRVLLSSIEGAAVTGVQIEGIIHEFSSLPGVREDIIDIVLNLKGLVLRSYSDDEETLYLEVEGVPGELREVTARDIQPNSNVEIINLDHHLAEIDEEAKLSMKISVKKGRGYLEVEGRDIKEDYNFIPIDALFTPVKKVNFQVLDTRVGQLTNYDKLIIEIWTNGAITPQQALSQSLDLLAEEFSRFGGLLKEKIGESEPAEEVEEDEETSEAETSIEELELSVRAYNCLKRAHIDTVQELVSILQERPEDLKKIKNLGQKTFEEIVEKVEKWSSEVESKEEKGVNKGEAPAED
ncbi:MAG TPA: DNA-directed RNA polymerase subunit alpha [Candidatus Atribacteria bacterium]|jgi:DNA-directed RNA polymerase subunit alpha|uniref:DNA-directed RNA polymerase subunit alpha n=1 Tax=Candidatus Sordicultor fermentans TaxID=1953203 RepID=UPI00169D1CF1|nr:DNA-directed RNA polymerase subunit alpha [Atribacterota bacterium]NLY06200.1 DNA-directed RNA polymerase subunit alpha [Candidatus Atribacteria bacterium]MDI9607778.1 DNA-directed RNA polymerase subunit alpha [Atribacterota bacterium]HOA98709.1 DNA-directed RNA polymerase subunit alpha [Candidatus Atribacteria bacterium]HOQ50559.1 DNA-directed RNA polymerase subunit alpha [Candidatus Atribacteria bacterium]